jgi:hypothetical protein
MIFPLLMVETNSNLANQLNSLLLSRDSDAIRFWNSPVLGSS